MEQSPAAESAKADSKVTGLVAEWSCSGLQIRVRRFNSDPGLQSKQKARLTPGFLFLHRDEPVGRLDSPLLKTLA